jgi:uncharacterized cofD-like protein
VNVTGEWLRKEAPARIRAFLEFLSRTVKWLSPGMKIKRWLLISWVGHMMFTLGFMLLTNIRVPVDIELFIQREITHATGWAISTAAVEMILIISGLFLMALGLRQGFISIYRVIVPYEDKHLVDVIYEKRHLGHGLKIVVMGGGTGLSSLLRGIKHHTSNIAAVVTVSDDGGSSGRIRKEMGLLPPGDIRNCLVALAEDESLLSELFTYRFSEGTLDGHNFGNLFLAALTNMAGDFDKAVKLSGRILAIQGKVLPATLSSTVLCAEYENGDLVEGESEIPRHRGRIKRVFLKPGDVEPPPEVIHHIEQADAVILGPGSLFTSVIPNLLVKSISHTLSQSAAVKVYVCNVMTQPGETDGYTASDHVRAITEHAGSNIVDFVVVNDSLPQKLLEKYSREGSFPVPTDIDEVEGAGAKAITAHVMAETDLVRHDSKKLAETVIGIVVGELARREREHRQEERGARSPERLSV